MGRLVYCVLEVLVCVGENGGGVVCVCVSLLLLRGSMVVV